MKKIIFALFLCAGFALPALSQSNPPLRLQEVDGSPNVLGVTTIKVTNGTLSCSGKVCTLTISGGGGITVGTTTITSGINTRVLFNNAGVVGEYAVTGTGNAVLSASPTLSGTVAMAAQTNSGTIVQTSASATAFESGANGGTNPVFRLVNNVASTATGLSITGNAAGSGVTLTALSSGTNESILLTPKGTGSVVLPAGSASAPKLTFANSATTGLYSESGGILSFTVSGTQWGRLHAASGGGLDVYGDGGANPFIRFGSGQDVQLTRAAAAVLSVGGGVGHTLRYVPDSPTQITADQNNYQAGSGRSYFYRLSSDASRNITGFNPAGGTNQNGETHVFVNAGSNNIVLVNESASSTAANRFTNSTGADITLAANEAAMVFYDGTSSRWRVFKY